MKPNASGLSHRYNAALRKHIKTGRSSSLRPAKSIGRQAITLGLETLHMARLHEQALITLVLPDYPSDTRDMMVERAAAFFAEAITPLEKTHRPAREVKIRLGELYDTLRQRGVDLSVSRRQVKEQIALRQAVEESLRKSKRHYTLLLEHSERMQEELRLLSRKLLSAQEEERKKISRELHDVIAQTLTSINVRLGTLKQDAAHNTKGLARNIARTQLLVEQSVDIVHQFARELRPRVLDDLGLVPALHTFMKSFRAETGIAVSLSAFAAVEKVNGDKRTVLYRVAQEALNNVARHAQATQAEVKIEQMNGTISMKIKDNGKGFQEERVLHAKKSRRLGLLGMRERLEMVGGGFAVTSTPGKGTTVVAQIPLMDVPPGRGRPVSRKKQT